ncbi:DUF2948 family protein [Hyphomonas sp. WL0036]|uniref:DUF2948 family protein n=1 Tax=Hyphomonas sediminis TaxID=2866160 RepID=UPI001C81FE97|nr:DUF2948 family protein [Hyphomonas sediminis]MBY9067334.1 DUF2948 family protein [Hyphomonas sediminis]
MTELKSLRLFTEEAEDLKIIAAAVQDSVVKAGNLKYEQKQRRFTLELNRYRWETAPTRKGQPGERVRAILGFDGVMAVKTRGITKADPELILSLLNIEFAPDAEPPGGKVTLLFAGDGELELTVEALDATLLDSDYVWPTRNAPSHERRKR